MGKRLRKNHAFALWTGNPGQVRGHARDVGGQIVELVSPGQIGLALPEVDESGRTRFRTPASRRGLPSGRGDAGVLLRLGAVSEGLPEALQPGVHVRRVGDRSLTDEEMTAYYSPWPTSTAAASSPSIETPSAW